MMNTINGNQPIVLELNTESEVADEIARLDRNWDRDRQNFMALGRYGQMYIPTQVSSALIGFVCVAFGIFWIARTSLTLAPEGGANVAQLLFPGAGVILTTAIAIRAGRDFWKAGKYQEASKNYQHQRQLLVTQMCIMDDEA